MPFTVIRNDITKMNVDAIVNAANTDLLMGGGVCGAIFDAAGADKLQRACDELAPIKTGGAVITQGYSLPAKYIVHTAGPVYIDGKHNEEALLRSCYTNSLDIAKQFNCESLAFPLISSGIYGYPKDEALSVATKTITEWLDNNDMDVSLVVFDKTAFAISGELLGQVRAFIDENYVDERNLLFGRSRQLLDVESDALAGAAARQGGVVESEAYVAYDEEQSKPAPENTETLWQTGYVETKYGKPDKEEKRRITHAQPLVQLAHQPPPQEKKLDDVVARLDEPFSATLLRLIDAKGWTDVEIYKRANLDRKLFSKIRTGKGYSPSKKTAVALSIALELTLQETRDLLERAGFALSRSVVFDVIIEYFITSRKYDIFEINNVLFEYDQPLLGG